MTAPPDGMSTGPVALRPEPGHAGLSPSGPALADFRTGPETRLRDLLAFAMAVEAGRPLGPDGPEGLRRHAEAELQGHALRVLHNQVETIRQQAMAEQLARIGRGMSFGRAVLANLLALALAGGAVMLATGAGAGALAELFHRIAGLAAQLLPGS